MHPQRHAFILSVVSNFLFPPSAMLGVPYNFSWWKEEGMWERTGWDEAIRNVTRPFLPLCLFRHSSGVLDYGSRFRLNFKILRLLNHSCFLQCCIRTRRSPYPTWSDTSIFQVNFSLYRGDLSLSSPRWIPPPPQGLVVNNSQRKSRKSGGEGWFV